MRSDLGEVRSDVGTVREDVAFTLRRHKMSPADAAARVEAALDRVGLTELGDRPAHRFDEAGGRAVAEVAAVAEQRVVPAPADQRVVPRVPVQRHRDRDRLVAELPVGHPLPRLLVPCGHQHREQVVGPTRLPRRLGPASLGKPFSPGG